VVYMGSKSGDDPDDVLSQNHHMLASVHGGRSKLCALFNTFMSFVVSLFCFLFVGLMWCATDSVEQAQASHLYTYRHGFKGFAAKLTDEQASQIASKFMTLGAIYCFVLESE